MSHELVFLVIKKDITIAISETNSATISGILPLKTYSIIENSNDCEPYLPEVLKDMQNK